MNDALNRRAANITQLKFLAKSRIPHFVADYLCGGCNEDLAVRNNRYALDRVFLRPEYLTPAKKADASVQILGRGYAAPLGVAPLGLSGLVWPKASIYQARAAKAANIPFILSTVASISIEKAAECAGDNFWFQLYPPTDRAMLDDLLQRADASGCRHLVVTIDVPSLGRRPRDIRAGLTVPPRLNLRSIAQVLTRPSWALAMARYGKPRFETIMPYLKSSGDMSELSDFIRKTLKDIVDLNLLGYIRERWPHRLIVKGVINPNDARLAVEAGADAIIVSNHGGRQLDAVLPTITVLPWVRDRLGDAYPVMADSGVESGVDVARFLALGADMVFAGRAFMYGVAALGEKGAAHVIDILQTELLQIMDQLRCEHPGLLKNHRVGDIEGGDAK